MALSPELYARFIRGACTEEEEIFVRAYFREHPEEMETFLDESDWEGFIPDGKLHPAVLQRVFSNIQDSVDKHERKVIIWRKVAIAAVMMGVIVLAGSMLLRKQEQHMQLAVNGQQQPMWREYVNTGNKVKLLILDDSSRVELGAGSTLRCLEGFEKDKRELWLKGKAKFEVAKDGKRPFTVYAASTAVTALGTVFGVNERNSKVTVKLYSGKVVVHPQKGVSIFKEVYLQPGESLVYDINRKGQPLVNKPAVLNKEPESGQEVASSSLVFNQRPLPQVLAQLERHFNITISYDAKRLQHIRVSAEFTAMDTPAEILENIAALNGLTVERKGEAFVLKKSL